MIGAGDWRLFGAYTYMPTFVGPVLKALTLEMPWALPTATRAANVASVENCISIARLVPILA